MLRIDYITDRLTPKGDDIDLFVNGLTSKGLLQAAGDKGSTDIAALITAILESTDKDNISVFISDCIFSPGTVANPEAYLESQKIAIRNAVNDYIAQNKYVACSVYQIYSDFKGRYFDYKNHPVNIDMRRPFYIWVFGAPQHIATIKSRIPDDKFMGADVANSWTIMSGNILTRDEGNAYGLLQPSPSNGNYKWISKSEMSRIKKTNGRFIFTFGVDMTIPTLIYGKEYVTDARNYKHIVNKQTDCMFYGSFREDLVQSSPYTYDVTVISDSPFGKGSFSIVFDGVVPDWVSECTDDDDSILDSSNGFKTYGFRYMCDGIYAGFHANNTDNITAKYDFLIK